MKQRREVITAKRAMELLGISRPTLRAYVRQGLLTQINLSSRKVRFAQEQVEQLATTSRLRYDSYLFQSHYNKNFQYE